MLQVIEMKSKAVKRSTVKAVTNEVLPTVGIAYLVDDDQHTWTVTRSNSGLTFDKLQPGTVCNLTIDHYDHYALVGHCVLLND